MSIIRYGIIGAGAIAQRRHMPEAHAHAHSTVAAIADPSEGRAEAIAQTYGARPYTDYKAMLQDEDIDAVVVACPNAYHAPMTIAALEAGKHVLCEKPMATTREDARKMIATAERTKRHLMIAMNQRFMPAHITAKRILDSGRLGKVLTFRTAFKHGGPEAWSVDGSKSWFFDATAAFMGVTGDLGVHKVDLVRWLLGDEFSEVSAAIETLDKTGPDGKPIGLDDNAFLTLRTASNVLGTVNLSWTTYSGEENDTVIYCTNGVLKIGTDPDFAVTVDYRNGDRELHKVGALATNDSQVASGVIDAFTEAIRTDRTPEVDGTEGYRCLNVILTAMESAKAHKVTPIDNNVT
ncbi:MAG: Gfo/Idh/MocA family oxidoreductase [Phycisphaeraceae bacterium]